MRQSVPKSAGSTLIEVLLVLVMLLAAAGALIHFRILMQHQQVRLELRAAAMRLLASKLEDLQAFSQLRVSATETNYQSIRSNQGGVMPAGRYSEASHDLDLHWRVTDLPAWPGWDLPAGKGVLVQVEWLSDGERLQVQQATLLLPLRLEP